MLEEQDQDDVVEEGVEASDLTHDGLDEVPPIELENGLGLDLALDHQYIDDLSGHVDHGIDTVDVVEPIVVAFVVLAKEDDGQAKHDDIVEDCLDVQIKSE